MSWQELFEQAAAKNAEGIAIYDEMQKGERGIEDLDQADALMAEAGRLVERGQSLKAGIERDAYLNEGLGSLTVSEPGGIVEHTAPGSDKKDWQPFGEFALAVLAAKEDKIAHDWTRKGWLPEGAIERLYSEQAEMKTLAQEGLGSAGGFLVAVPYLPELFYKKWESTIVRSRARIIPMSTRQIQMPTLDQTITPVNQKSAFFAGVHTEWIEEGESKPETELKFKLVTLTVHELAAYLPVTNNLIEDSAISIDGLIRAILPAALVDAEDWWFLNGNGAGVPQGVIASPATIQVVRTGAGAIAWADIKKMVHAFQPGANGIWVAHICTMEEIMALQDAAGNALWLANIVTGMPQQLMGRPIVWTEKVPNLGTKGDIGLYDFSYYLVGDRRGPTLEMSDEYLFRYNQRAYRLSSRVDGQPWLSAPVMLRPTGAVSISPFVTLATYAG